MNDAGSLRFRLSLRGRRRRIASETPVLIAEAAEVEVGCRQQGPRLHLGLGSEGSNQIEPWALRVNRSRIEIEFLCPQTREKNTEAKESKDVDCGITQPSVHFFCKYVAVFCVRNSQTVCTEIG